MSETELSQRILNKLDIIHSDFAGINATVAVHSTMLDAQVAASNKLIASIEALDVRLRHVENTQVDLVKLNQLEERLRAVEQASVAGKVYTALIAGVCGILGTGVTQFVIYKLVGVH